MKNVIFSNPGHDQDEFILKLQKDTGLGLCLEPVPLGEWVLFFDGALRLHNEGAPQGDIFYDFKEMLLTHQRRNYALSKEPLARALGLKGNKSTSVLDCTCGTAKDSMLMLAFGAKVTAWERHPVAYALLAEAARNFKHEYFEIHFGDVKNTGRNYDVMYLDPMYSDKNKKAASRKEMMVFESMIGGDEDQMELLEWALSRARERVVVKRPLKAPPLRAKPTAQFKGKSTRYDMYSTK